MFRFSNGFKPFLLILYNIFAVSTMINAPNLLIGYGLVIPAMMLSLIFIRPLYGALTFLIGHILGSLILLYTHSAFTLVIFLSLLVRSLVLFILAILIEKGYLKDLPSLLLIIVSLDTFLAYSLALLYYGKDAIEVGLDIFSISYIPFIYLMHKMYREGYRIYSLAPFILMLTYYFSSAFFYGFALNMFSLVMLIILYKFRSIYRIKILMSIVIIGSILFGYLSMPYIYYNLDVVLYPYKPSTLSGIQWIQDKTGDFCREGNVFRYTYDPERLRILDKCVEVYGVVVSEIVKGDDGDIFFDVRLDPQYEYMLSIGSWVIRKGNIHVEIVPEDQESVYIPSKGERIRIIGVWVVDTDHGSYSEIHPTWYIEPVS